MKLQYRVLEYFLVTSFVWGMYLIWLIPFQLLWVGMEWDMFITWLFWGTFFEYIIAYPIAKAIVRWVPPITLYCQLLSDKHDKERARSKKA